MHGTLIAYGTSGASKTSTSRIAQRLYGQDTTSRGYKIRRKGLLENTPHIRLIRGVVVLRDKDAAAVRDLLQDLGCEIHERRIELTDSDKAELGIDT